MHRIKAVLNENSLDEMKHGVSDECYSSAAHCLIFHIAHSYPVAPDPSSAASHPRELPWVGSARRCSRIRFARSQWKERWAGCNQLERKRGTPDCIFTTPREREELQIVSLPPQRKESYFRSCFRDPKHFGSWLRDPKEERVTSERRVTSDPDFAITKAKSMPTAMLPAGNGVTGKGAIAATLRYVNYTNPTWGEQTGIVAAAPEPAGMSKSSKLLGTRTFCRLHPHRSRSLHCHRTPRGTPHKRFSNCDNLSSHSAFSHPIGQALGMLFTNTNLTWVISAHGASLLIFTTSGLDWPETFSFDCDALWHFRGNGGNWFGQGAVYEWPGENGDVALRVQERKFALVRNSIFARTQTAPASMTFRHGSQNILFGSEFNLREGTHCAIVDDIEARVPELEYILSGSEFKFREGTYRTVIDTIEARLPERENVLFGSEFKPWKAWKGIHRTIIDDVKVIVEGPARIAPIESVSLPPPIAVQLTDICQADSDTRDDNIDRGFPADSRLSQVSHPSITKHIGSLLLAVQTKTRKDAGGLTGECFECLCYRTSNSPIMSTPIQACTISALHSGHDVVEIAQTGKVTRAAGSGKTAGYLISIISKLVGKAKKLDPTLRASPFGNARYSNITQNPMSKARSAGTCRPRFQAYVRDASKFSCLQIGEGDECLTLEFHARNRLFWNFPYALSVGIARVRSKGGQTHRNIKQDAAKKHKAQHPQQRIEECIGTVVHLQ
ncbi:uncharacterized protein MYCFIDRAFT_180074 [Pseudocercospora fijiensis CIRAD86]|uniref:Uncharacterized protein n=1 Tax=Pseudocercospora fijiensis (strain CIRAD86) TaxID=383855 RepID=M3AI92_PSEFD|nr:uncharacterized protein MYCFIDRAFT_180074 [Pseudocercospora fijiensis CIRAD86]EME77197.1 hypothetical protein MYCFIDRAFT_180074 [Pseudocercospora fijiensis CIRAD86]